jgi:hypothetical protein
MGERGESKKRADKKYNSATKKLNYIKIKIPTALYVDIKNISTNEKITISQVIEKLLLVT